MRLCACASVSSVVEVDDALARGDAATSTSGTMPTTRATLARSDSARREGGESARGPARALARSGSARDDGGRARPVKSVSFARAISTTIACEDEFFMDPGEQTGSHKASARRRSDADKDGGREHGRGLDGSTRGAFDNTRMILSEDIFGVDAKGNRSGRSRGRE